MGAGRHAADVSCTSQPPSPPRVGPLRAYPPPQIELALSWGGLERPTPCAVRCVCPMCVTTFRPGPRCTSRPPPSAAECQCPTRPFLFTAGRGCISYLPFARPVPKGTARHTDVYNTGHPPTHVHTHTYAGSYVFRTRAHICVHKYCTSR